MLFCYASCFSMRLCLSRSVADMMGGSCSTGLTYSRIKTSYFSSFLALISLWSFYLTFSLTLCECSFWPCVYRQILIDRSVDPHANAWPPAGSTSSLQIVLTELFWVLPSRIARQVSVLSFLSSPMLQTLTIPSLLPEYNVVLSLSVSSAVIWSLCALSTASPLANVCSFSLMLNLCKFLSREPLISELA